MCLICFSLHPSGPEWTQEAKHTGLQEVLMNFPSHLGPAAFFFSPLTLFGAFFMPTTFCQPHLSQKPSSFSASSNSGLNKLADLCSRPIISLILMLNLCTSYSQSSNFREFVVTLFFSFCILDFFHTRCFIIKIITRQKEMAGGSQYAVTERRTCTLKNMTGCGLKHRLNFQTWHFQGKCWNAGGG